LRSRQSLTFLIPSPYPRRGLRRGFTAAPTTFPRPRRPAWWTWRVTRSTTQVMRALSSASRRLIPGSRRRQTMAGCDHGSLSPGVLALRSISALAEAWIKDPREPAAGHGAPPTIINVIILAVADDFNLCRRWTRAAIRTTAIRMITSTSVSPHVLKFPPDSAATRAPHRVIASPQVGLARDTPSRAR